MSGLDMSPPEEEEEEEWDDAVFPPPVLTSGGMGGRGSTLGGCSVSGCVMASRAHLMAQTVGTV